MSMRKLYIGKLAVKNIVGHKLRSILTILGIAIGVGFITFLVSLGYGLQKVSTEEIANLEALQIIDATPGKSKIVKINEEALEKFKGIAYAEDVQAQTELVGTFGFGSSSVEGVVYSKNLEYLNLEEINLESGSRFSSNSEKEAMINMTMARQLGINDYGSAINKDINIEMNISSELFEDRKEPLNYQDDFKIVGIIKNEDSPYAYIPLDVIKEQGVVNYSSAKIKISDKDYVDEARQQIEGLGYKTSALKDTVDQINKFFSIFQIILLSFGLIAVLIAALGMFNTLTISLLEKTREISFMKIMGTTSRDIWKMFIAEALIIGFIGGAIGISFGLGAGSFLNDFIANLAARTGNRTVQIFYAPVQFVIAIFVSTLLVSFLTGVYPSRRATKIDPMEVMRYE